MQTINNMPLDQAIELYYLKHDALRKGNLEVLIQLKKEHPELFSKDMDKQIRDIIAYAKEFAASPRYKELQKMLLEDQLNVIETDPV